jgi:hypothetical protein
VRSRGKPELIEKTFGEARAQSHSGGDRVQIIASLFAGRLGICATVSRRHGGVILFMPGDSAPGAAEPGCG